MSRKDCIQMVPYTSIFQLSYYSRAFDHEVIDGPGAAGRGRKAVTFLYLQYHLSRYRDKSL